MIKLTSEYIKAPLARAVPGANWSRDAGAWVLDDPSPRAAAVALKLFPGIEHDYPVLLELRDLLARDAKPVDYATPYYANVYREQMPEGYFARRVATELAKRGWAFHEYQEIDLTYAAAVLREHKGFYMGWSRGLGKTIGTAALFDELDVKSAVVIAPNTAKGSVWGRELEWVVPWLEVIVLGNSAAARSRALNHARVYAKLGEPFVLVVHYEALAVIAGKTKNGGLGDGWKRLKIDWDIVVADEGHRFANPKSKLSRAAKKLGNTADMRLLLSGSVFQNRWEELFSQLQFLFPQRYTSAWRDWNDRFLDYVENGYGRICVGVLEDQVEAMRDELGRFMVYREKESTATQVTLKVNLSPTQRAAYEELRETCLATLEDGTMVKAQVGIAMLTKLRMIATGLDLLTGELSDSSKLDAVVDMIAADETDDFVVFAWYKRTTYALAQRLQDRGIESFVVTGDVPHETRADYIDGFRDGERRVFIGTIATLGEAVNLQRANQVVMIDQSWNPALNQQAVDRVDRQGQTRPVTITKLVAADTVDELTVLPALANKEALKAAILGGS